MIFFDFYLYLLKIIENYLNFLTNFSLMFKIRIIQVQIFSIYNSEIIKDDK